MSYRATEKRGAAQPKDELSRCLVRRVSTKNQDIKVNAPNYFETRGGGHLWLRTCRTHRTGICSGVEPDAGKGYDFPSQCPLHLPKELNFLNEARASVTSVLRLAPSILGAESLDE